MKSLSTSTVRHIKHNFCSSIDSLRQMSQYNICRNLSSQKKEKKKHARKKSYLENLSSNSIQFLSFLSTPELNIKHTLPLKRLKTSSLSHEKN